MKQAFLLTFVLAGFWIACVATTHVHEMILGLFAVGFSVAFCIFIFGTLPLQFSPSMKDLVQVWRLPWYMVARSFEITLVLGRDLLGHRAASLLRSAPYRRISKSSSDTAERVLAVAYTTAAPNFIVVGIDRERGQMLFHQVEKSGVSLMTQRLGAENQG